MTIEDWTHKKYPWLARNERLFQVLCGIENFNPELPIELYKPAKKSPAMVTQIKTMERLNKNE